MDCLSNPVKILEHYKVHILVFLLAFLAALTFAHPAFFFNDEWITGNQLAQLIQGHQVLVNEGKYGVFDNGTPTEYFLVRHNYLGYPLFYSLTSLPAEGIVNVLGGHFIFFITYLWTFLVIGIALVLNAFFPEYTYLRKWRWTTGLFIFAFVVFFLNLIFYKPFPITGKDAFPEILALVLTNVLLFALLAVTVYEIVRVIFKDIPTAVFGTVVCLSCSSYFFWTTVGKDHVLVAFLISLILLLIITFILTENLRALAGGFFLVGFLAWARPDLGFFIFIALCCIVGIFFLIVSKDKSRYSIHCYGLILTPVFTVLGAIPFFINNYIATHNIFIPAFVPSMEAAVSPAGVVENNVATYTYSLDTLVSLLNVGGFTTNSPVSSLPADLFGIFFVPQSGSIGVLPLVPIFFAAIFVVLLKMNNTHFSRSEKIIIGTLILFSTAILGAYITRAYGLNHDLGIMPDIRYLSPLYLPLTIIGLMIFKKIPGIMDKPGELLIGISAIWIVGIPVSLAMLLWHHPVPFGWENIFSLVDYMIAMVIFITVLLFTLLFSYSMLCKGSTNLIKFFRILFVFLCAYPLIWQIDVSFLSLLYLHDNGGYFYWIPLLLKGIYMVH